MPPPLTRTDEQIFSLDVFVESFAVPLAATATATATAASSSSSSATAGEGLPPGARRSLKLSAAFHFLDYEPVLFSAPLLHRHSSSSGDGGGGGDGSAPMPVKVRKGRSCYFRSSWAVLQRQVSDNPLHVVLLVRGEDGRDEVIGTAQVRLD